MMTTPLDTGRATTLVDMTMTCRARAAATRRDIAVAALGEGRPILLCDDAERPRRAEMVIAAESAQVHTMAFAVRHTSGFLQVALPAERCAELDLGRQCGSGLDGRSNQCVTVDARSGIGTGISACDRAATARLLTSAHATADSFTRPGHMVPIRVDMHCSSSDFGFPEAALHLVCAAGCAPGAVIGSLEGLADPTMLAGGRDIAVFADMHRLPVVGLRDIVADTRTAATFDVDVSARNPESNSRLLSFSDSGYDFLCLVVGDVRHRHGVRVDAVAMEHFFDEASTNMPRILLGVRPLGSSGATLSNRELVDLIGDDHSVLHAVIGGSGACSVSVTTAF